MDEMTAQVQGLQQEMNNWETALTIFREEQACNTTFTDKYGVSAFETMCKLFGVDVEVNFPDLHTQFAARKEKG